MDTVSLQGLQCLPPGTASLVEGHQEVIILRPLVSRIQRSWNIVYTNSFAACSMPPLGAATSRLLIAEGARAPTCSNSHATI